MKPFSRRQIFMEEHIDRIKEAVVNGNRKNIEGFVKQAIKDKIEFNAIINNALIAAMDIVGQKFSDGEMFVPEMMISAIAMKMGLQLIKPLMVEGEGEKKGTILIATVRGDMHDIGKNLVAMMFEGAGFNVVDMGVDVREEKILQHVKDDNPDVLALSCLLTTTTPQMKSVIEALISEGCRDNVKVIIGGAPVDQAFANKIGADGYGQDASEAVQLARRFISVT